MDAIQALAKALRAVESAQTITQARKDVRALRDEVRAALPPDAAQAPIEVSPEFTDSARAALVWVLYHHQGGSSPVGQPIRFALGMGAHEPLHPTQIGEALKLAKESHWAWARELPRTSPVAPQAAGDAAQAPIYQISDGASWSDTDWLEYQSTASDDRRIVYAAPVYPAAAGKLTDQQREAIKKAAFMLTIFSGHDSGANLLHYFGKAWHHESKRHAATLRTILAAPTPPVAADAATPADLTLLRAEAQAWNRVVEACADAGCPSGTDVTDWIRDLAKRAQTTEQSGSLTDEQIIREFYIYTVMDDEPLFTFDRKSALELARTLLAAQQEQS